MRLRLQKWKKKIPRRAYVCQEMPGQPDSAQSGSLGPFRVGQTGEVPRLASESVPCLLGAGINSLQHHFRSIGHPEPDRNSQVN